MGEPSISENGRNLGERGKKHFAIRERFNEINCEIQHNLANYLCGKRRKI